MKTVKDNMEISELAKMAESMHGNLVKAIVDVEKKIMAVDADMHSDLFELLMAKEQSEQEQATLGHVGA